MNLVIVNDYAYVYGGAAKVAVTSAVEFARRGVQVTFLAAVGPIGSELKGIENLTVVCLDQIPFTQRGARHAMTDGLWDKRAFAAMAGILDGQKPADTVIHVHSNRDALSSSVLAPAFEGGYPVVYSNHDYTLGCPYGAFFNQRTLEICPLRGLSAPCLMTYCNRGSRLKGVWMRRRQQVQIKSGIPSRLSDVIYVSEFSRQVLAPYVPAGVGQHVVKNPVSADPTQKRILKSDSPFLFVGLFDPGKDPVTAALAAKQAGVPISFVGEGEFRERIAEANPDAEITGWLSSDKVRDRLLNARALVFPVRWYETQGLVVQEAASVGLPAIVADTCAATDTIVDGESGFWFKAGDVEGLASRMKELMSDKVAQRMGDAVYAKFWADPPTLESHCDQLMRIYENAMKGAA